MARKPYEPPRKKGMDKRGWQLIDRARRFFDSAESNWVKMADVVRTYADENYAQSYMAKALGVGQPYISRLCQAGISRQLLIDGGADPPETEVATRPLNTLRGDPERLMEAWELAGSIADAAGDDRVTAVHTAEAVRVVATDLRKPRKVKKGTDSKPRPSAAHVNLPAAQALVIKAIGSLDKATQHLDGVHLRTVEGFIADLQAFIRALQPDADQTDMFSVD